MTPGGTDDGSLRALLLTHVFPRHADDAAAPFLLRYAQGLVNAGVEVRVVAPHDAGLPWHHEVAGIPVRRVRYADDSQETLAYRGHMHVESRTRSGAWRAVKLVAALRRGVRLEIADWRPHVLDVHWLIPGGIVTRLAGVGIPSEVVVHGTDVALAVESGPRRAVARWALGAFDVVAAASRPLADELERKLGRPVDAVAAMPPGPPPSDVPDPPGAARVLTVGRLVPEKGYDDLLRAVARLQGEGQEVRLTMVGEGPDEARLVALADELGLPIELRGSLSPVELDAAYAETDLVVVPSHREGFGLVAVEALARHRPVVASTAGGLAEIVEDGVTGWAVPPGDVAALAQAVGEALGAPQEAARRAAAGASRYEDRWTVGALGSAAAERLRRLAEVTPARP